MGVVKLHSVPGHEYVFRERALGSNAITEIFASVMPQFDRDGIDSMPACEVEALTPFVGEIYMGHLRYSTTGKSGISYVHPFLRRNNWRSRNLMMCGNFNMTNVDEIFKSIVKKGQHPRIYSDTIVLLEQLGYALDRENHRIYRELRDTLEDPQLGIAIEDNINIKEVLKTPLPPGTEDMSSAAPQVRAICLPFETATAYARHSITSTTKWLCSPQRDLSSRQ